MAYSVKRQSLYLIGRISDHLYCGKGKYSYAVIPALNAFRFEK